MTNFTVMDRLAAHSSAHDCHNYDL